jgi:hypothetical protein
VQIWHLSEKSKDIRNGAAFWQKSRQLADCFNVQWHKCTETMYALSPDESGFTKFVTEIRSIFYANYGSVSKLSQKSRVDVVR